MITDDDARSIVRDDAHKRPRAGYCAERGTIVICGLGGVEHHFDKQDAVMLREDLSAIFAERRTPEIRRDHNGQVDEVCVESPQSFHLERMGTHSWWMRIECGDSAVVVNFTARSMPLVEIEKAKR